MSKNNLKDTTLIEVVNNTGGGVAYHNEMGILRRWERPGSIKKIQLLELQQSISQTGVYNLFERGSLLINHNNATDVMDMLGIPELDEYVCTLDEIEELLSGSDYEDLRAVLKWGAKSQTETIVSLATNKNLKDANVISIIKDVVGVDVTIESPLKEEKQVEATKPSRKKADNDTVEEVEEKPARKKAPAKKTNSKTE
jgi:hypothetical protein